MFIISEIAPQFGNDLDLAEQMILQSKMGGANAAKVQLYPADMFTQNPSNYLKSRELSFEDFKRLKEYGDKIGIPVFATAFDEERLEWCKALNQKYYKVAARQHKENPGLVEKITSLDKTTFVSIPNDYDVSKITPRENCIYLHCVNQYPTLLEDVILPESFSNGLFTGLSDHSLGISAALLAVTRGCQYLEKHFSIDHFIQRSNEKAHLGSMNLEQLTELKRLSLQLELLIQYTTK